jgi:hypothetical protein
MKPRCVYELRPFQFFRDILAFLVIFTALCCGFGIIPWIAIKLIK